MPRNAAVSVENKFINGLVTEATALNFPESAVTEAINCNFSEKGNVSRRLGVDFEEGYVTDEVDTDDAVINTFEWRNAGGNGNNTFVVRQVGQILRFFKVGLDGSISSHLESHTINLTTFSAPGAPDPKSIECQFTYGYGYLFVTHPYLESFYVSYDDDTGLFTSQEISIKIRDFEGLVDGLETDDRPSTLSDNHKYNLYNQGWAPFESGGVNSVVVEYTRPEKTFLFYNAPNPNYVGDPLRTWQGNRTDNPSNADIWWLYKDSKDAFNPLLASARMRGNSPAPKGHYILNAFYQDRSAAVQDTVSNGWSGSSVVSIPNIPVVTSGYMRPRCVAFFAGRVWYAGVDYEGYNNKCYFSQIVKSPEQFGKCYQNNDPTSEAAGDLLATDGGDLSILDCGTIIRMIPMQSSLVIFANNGIWAITGSTGFGFTPSDYSVRKISSTPTISPSSFVDVGGYSMWWNAEGIYTITGDDQGQVSVQSVTDKKIKSFFKDEIPTQTKFYARGYYNPLTRVVQWIYRDTPSDDLKERYRFNRILCLNINTGAFYPHKIESTEISLSGIIVITGLGTETEIEDITDDDLNPVVDAADEQVTISVTYTSEFQSTFKYLVSYVLGSATLMTFAEEKDENFIDWFVHNGVGSDYESYFVSGYKVHGDAQKDFQSNYIYMYSDHERPSQYFLQGVWDYAENGSTGRWSSRQKIALEESDYSFRIVRRKIRGRGKSLQIRVASVDHEPFDIVGWSVFETGNTSV